MTAPSLSFTRDLPDEQEAFATKYVTHAHRGDPVNAGYEIARHNCGTVTVYLIDMDEDNRLESVDFTPAQLRDFTTEVGQFWHDKGRLGEVEMNALHRLQLAAAYADGEVTKTEMEELQADFEADSDMVSKGIDSLRFRKHPDEVDQ